MTLNTLTKLLGALALTSTTLPALATESYPDRPIQMTVPFPGGGPVDVLARAFAQAFGKAMGQNIVVMNRDGGSTTVGMNSILAAPADGYNIIYGPVTALTVHPHWMKGMPFKPEAFTPVCQTFENIFVLVTNPARPIADLKTLLADAKQRPGSLTYGHPGIASSPHLAGAELFLQAGVDMRDVPYRGETPMLPTLKAGEVDTAVVTTGYALTHGFAGLATFSEQRLASLPDVPTVKELGYSVTPSGYGGLFVKAGTPDDVIQRIESACRTAVSDAAFQDMAGRQYQQAEFLGRDGLTQRIRKDYDTKAQLIPKLNIQ